MHLQDVSLGKQELDRPPNMACYSIFASKSSMHDAKYFARMLALVNVNVIRLAT